MATRIRLTHADFERLPEDAAGRRQELLDGRLVVSPAPSLRHARTVLRIVNALQAWTRERGGEVVAGNYEIVLADDQALVPDVLLMVADHVGRLEERYLRRPPDLVVEVCSSRDSKSRDLGPKRRAYGRFGVPEYWVVDLDDDVVLAFRHDAGASAPPIRYETDATLTTPLLPDFEARVADLLGPRH